MGEFRCITIVCVFTEMIGKDLYNEKTCTIR